MLLVQKKPRPDPGKINEAIKFFSSLANLNPLKINFSEKESILSFPYFNF
jgi:hypothetical protein